MHSAKALHYFHKKHTLQRVLFIVCGGVFVAGRRLAKPIRQSEGGEMPIDIPCEKPEQSLPCFRDQLKHSNGDTEWLMSSKTFKICKGAVY